MMITKFKDSWAVWRRKISGNIKTLVSAITNGGIGYVDAGGKTHKISASMVEGGGGGGGSLCLHKITLSYSYNDEETGESEEGSASFPIYSTDTTEMTYEDVAEWLHNAEYDTYGIPDGHEVAYLANGYYNATGEESSDYATVIGVAYWPSNQYIMVKVFSNEWARFTLFDPDAEDFTFKDTVVEF